MSTSNDSSDDATANQVFLRGRLAVGFTERELPSGDLLAVFRITVPRPLGERVRVDSLECTSVAPRVRRNLGRAVAGDLLEVTGCLRRRFWRSPSGPASRYTVEASSVKIIRPGRRVAASRARKPVSG